MGSSFRAGLLLVAFFASLIVSASANPLRGVKNLSYSPRITYPTKGEVWTGGSQERATWDTSKIPNEVKGTTVKVVLGYYTDNEESEHLDYEHPLAEAPITAGHVEFTVPKELPQRKRYILVVMGNSGNASPEFTIKPN